MTDPAVPPAPSARTCEQTGLRLVSATGQHVYRIQKPSWGPMNPPLRRGDFASVGGWGRWDAAGHRTIYSARPKRYAYQEILAYVAPAPTLGTTLMNDVFDDVDDQAGSVLEAIASEWEGKMPPRHVARQWRDERMMYELKLPSDGWFIDIGHGDSLAALNSAAGPAAGLLAPTRLLTLEDLFGTDRSLTCEIATRLHGLVLDDGWLAHGIYFQSKWGADGECWAVWLRATDDGNPTAEPTDVSGSDTIRPPDQDLELKAAANALAVCVF